MGRYSPSIKKNYNCALIVREWGCSFRNLSWLCTPYMLAGGSSTIRHEMDWGKDRTPTFSLLSMVCAPFQVVPFNTFILQLFYPSKQLLRPLQQCLGLEFLWLTARLLPHRCSRKVCRVFCNRGKSSHVNIYHQHWAHFTEVGRENRDRSWATIP